MLETLPLPLKKKPPPPTSETLAPPPFTVTLFGLVRIASPEMLPLDDLLPHVICSPPVFAGGGEHEAYQHDDA
jgi:hypothetical protein